MKRFWMVAAIILVGLSVSGVAQQKKNAFKVKPSAEDKAEKHSSGVALPKANRAAGGANARDLNALEHETAKSSTASTKRTAVKKAPAVKLEKAQKNAPINFGSSAPKGTGGIGQAANPYKGRLKQKGSHKY